jgi:hypothetical protein
MFIEFTKNLTFYVAICVICGSVPSCIATQKHDPMATADAGTVRIEDRNAAVSVESRSDVQARDVAGVSGRDTRLEHIGGIAGGNARIGGGGDSVTAWILAAGLVGLLGAVVVCVIGGGLFYMLVLRPWRMGREAEKQSNAEARRAIQLSGEVMKLASGE